MPPPSRREANRCNANIGESRVVCAFFALFTPHIPRGVILSGGEKRKALRAGVEVLRVERRRRRIERAKPAPKGRDLRAIAAIFSAFIYIFVCTKECNPTAVSRQDLFRDPASADASRFCPLHARVATKSSTPAMPPLRMTLLFFV